MAEKRMTTEEERRQELGKFPHIDYGRSTSEKNKFQYPYRPTDKEVKEFYKKHGHQLLSEGELQEMVRFNIIKKVYHKPDYETEKPVYPNMAVLSKPSSDVICIRKNPETGEIELCISIQVRTPYNVEVDGTIYTRFFAEHVGGLVDEDQTFEEAALRETEEEIGWSASLLVPLISPIICKHVSFATESTKMFLAVVDKYVGQRLDQNEDIKPKWYRIDTVEEELEAYLDGKKETFFGFDAPEMTILGFTRFFARWHRKFDLLEVKEALGGVETLEKYI